MIQGMNDVISFQHHPQPLDRPAGIKRAYGVVFTEDLQGVLKGAKHDVLVGVVHSSRHAAESGIQVQLDGFVPTAWTNELQFFR